MFKSTTLLLFWLTLLPVLQPTRSMAEIAESDRNNNNVTQQSDPTIAPPTGQRTPESIERERERTRIRQQTALDEQLEWRRRYGDLAPSRHSER